MKIGYIIFVLTFNTLICSAQVLKFTVIQAETGLPLDGVEVFSHETHNKVIYTSKLGSVRFDIKHTDTLIFFKQLYHPLYIQIKRLNFDTSHVVVLKMVPTNGESHGYMTREFDKLQKSKYQFEHDSLSSNFIQITNFKSPSLTGYPKYNDKAFHVVEIGLDKPGPTRVKSSYLEK